MSLDVYLTKTVEFESDDETVYHAYITHNLTAMADKAGLYEMLWRPDEVGISKAADLIEPLGEGLARLEANPDGYRELNPKNGWGSYEGLVRFTRDYLDACKQYPDADVYACR